MKWLIIGFIKAWRAVISPWYNVCRYYPSCSAYGLEAVQLHGAIKGSWLIVRRIGRCNPWSRGGVDPVPGSPLEAEIAREEAEAVTETSREATTSTTMTSAGRAQLPMASLPSEVASCC